MKFDPLFRYWSRRRFRHSFEITAGYNVTIRPDAVSGLQCTASSGSSREPAHGPEQVSCVVHQGEFRPSLIWLLHVASFVFFCQLTAVVDFNDYMDLLLQARRIQARVGIVAGSLLCYQVLTAHQLPRCYLKERNYLKLKAFLSESLTSLLEFEPLLTFSWQSYAFLTLLPQFTLFFVPATSRIRSASGAYAHALKTFYV